MKRTRKVPTVEDVATFNTRKFRGDPKRKVGIPVDSEYVPVHPMADEPALLAKLRMVPEDCRSVDVYWRIGEQVLFVQIWGPEMTGDAAPGLYWRKSRHQNKPPVLTAAVPPSPITSTQVHDVLVEFFRRGVLDRIRRGTRAKYAVPFPDAESSERERARATRRRKSAKPRADVRVSHRRTGK